MPRFRLRLRLCWKILLYASSLLVALIAAMLAFVDWQAKRFVNQQLATELEQGRRRVLEASGERFERLNYLAHNLASYPDLKALLDTGDTPTIRDFLETHRAQNGLDLLVALEPTGKVVARTDTAEAIALPEAQRWIQSLLAGREARGFLTVEGQVYQATAVPAEAGSTVFGFLIAGARVDDAYARRLADLTSDEVVLVGGDRVLGSSLSQSRLVWRTRAEWEQHVGREQTELDLAGATYSGAAAPLAGDGPLAVVLKSRTEALAPYRGIQVGLLAIGLGAALAGIFGSALLARSVTAPIARLEEGTAQVAAGNFDFHINMRSGDEIAALAASFNKMTEGLREPLGEPAVEAGEARDHAAGIHGNLRQRGDTAHQSPAPLGPLDYNYHLPTAGVRVELAPRWSLSGEWNYHGYNEKSEAGPTLPHEFRGNVFTTGVRYAF